MLPEAHLLALAKLPEDQWASVYDEAKRTAPPDAFILKKYGTKQQKLTASHVRRVVQSYLEDNSTESAPDVTDATAPVTDVLQIATLDARSEAGVVNRGIRFDRKVGRLLVVVQTGPTLKMIGISLDELRSAGLRAADIADDPN